MSTQAQKIALSIDDFANWKRIEKRQISPNGKFIIYELNAQKGDGNLVIYNVNTNENDSIPLGYEAIFSPNSDFIAFKLKPAADTVRKAKLAELKKDKMPKDTLAVVNLVTKKITKYPDIESFKMSEKNNSWLAMLIKHKEPKEAINVGDTNQITDTIKIEKKAKKKNKDSKDLILLDPINNNQYTFSRVEDYVVAKKGNTIALISKLSDSTEMKGIITFNTQNSHIDTLFQDSLTFKKITLSEIGDQLAFLASADTIDEKVFSLYYASLNKPEFKIIADTLTPNLPNQWSPSEKGSIYFSENGLKLFFGTAIKPVHEPNDSILDEDKPKIDVWSWTDIDLQPMQLLNREKEKKRTYLTIYHTKENKVVQLADSLIENIRLVNKKNGEWALGYTNKPYRRASSWNGRWLNDYYLINTKTGNKQLVLKGKSEAHLSPSGKYIVWYEQNDSTFYAQNNKTGKTITLNKNLPVIFCDELNDMPTNPYTYGVAGWSESDKFIFIYDRFDLWKFDLSGKIEPQNMTAGHGRKNNISFRYQKLDPDLVYIPSNTMLIFKGINEENFEEGYYSLILDSPKKPTELVKGDYILGTIQKAKNTNDAIWNTQTVSKYPEIKFSKLDFKNPKEISNANKQQSDFIWATSEIVSWQSFTGDTLKGILYKPENFDASKKYPMMVYFYERSSHTKNAYSLPSPSRSIINKTFYASNGYLVFVPDITYKTGYPGQSAYDAIISGVNYLTNTFTFVDASHMALQGQSWGGYQIAWLITQTDMFAAAMAGAPVSNMTSAYGGIRWGSGMSRMFQYEHSQSRIGGTLWERPLLYLENSPVFHAPKVNTPLLIMHNDNDGAVPWYQGIEYFVALRRLNKPVWMLNYNGMKHNIESKYWANRIDLSLRMFQFFNHYLKNEPAPEWMIKGVSATEKGDNLGY